jgi:hypothetical protein
LIFSKGKNQMLRPSELEDIGVAQFNRKLKKRYLESKGEKILLETAINEQNCPVRLFTFTPSMHEEVH